MYIKRSIADQVVQLAKQFPVVGITGPRQSGKTTLTKQLFPDYAYVTLEDIDVRTAAQQDPRRFFASFDNKPGVIIDEIQVVPDLFSYMQGIVDAKNKPGQFIITGSQNFLLMEKISQSLAGRIALLTLLPLSIEELQGAGISYQPVEFLMQKGQYPRLYAHDIDTEAWLSSYIATYVERDVRQVLNISDVVTFQRFIKLCAARVGNLINFADLARDCDISPNTAKAWISILESSYIIKLLQPYHANFNKRVIKSPKLYFYDTGLICYLLGITSYEDLFMHSMRGAIFESLIISELFKHYFNKGKQPHLYFWRDIQGHEIDCIIEASYQKLIPIEIKSSMTMQPDFLKNILYWNSITKSALPAFLIYAGNLQYETETASIVPWDKLATINK